jgi:DNA-binding CsgD family transcriptional regulator
LLVSLKLFPDRTSSGVGILELSSGGELTLRSSFGIPEKAQEVWATYSLANSSPVIEAMRTSETVVVSSVNEMLQRYPEHAGCHEPEDLSPVIAVPIRKLGSAVGALLITGSDVHVDNNCRQFLEIVAGLIALKLNTNSMIGEASLISNRHPRFDDTLTKRELLVQAMMKRGKTNNEIGEALGYSESTIRQDAVSMFIKLGVKDRKSAGELLADE